MIWVEVLSRHRDIAARFRIAAPEARIGRGYDNDVIIDDPYVAAQHLRVFRDETGQLVAEDLGSTNGTFLDGGRSRLARIVVDGKHPIRIGQTHLRIREIHHEVERERVAAPEWRTLPIAAAAALGASLLGLSALQVWLAQTVELRASVLALLRTRPDLRVCVDLAGAQHVPIRCDVVDPGGGVFPAFARGGADPAEAEGRHRGRAARYGDCIPGPAAVRGLFRLRTAVHDAPADAAGVTSGAAHRTGRVLWRDRQSQ